MIEQGKRYLVTADAWFYCPDGQQYRAAWGVCTVVEAKDALGVVPQRPSTNWYLKVGEGENSVILAGCQIHFLVQCEKAPAFIQGEITDKDGDKAPANRIWYTEPRPVYTEALKAALRKRKPVDRK